VAGMAGLYVLRPAGVQKVAVGRRRRRRRSYGSAHEQQLSAASVFINGYDIAAHLSLLVVVVAIMEHWIGRAGARGHLRWLCARVAEEGEGGGDGATGSDGRGAGELRYAAINSPPTLAAEQLGRARRGRR
jgi:hypothetical protein